MNRLSRVAPLAVPTVNAMLLMLLLWLGISFMIHGIGMAHYRCEDEVSQREEIAQLKQEVEVLKNDVRRFSKLTSSLEEVFGRLEILPR